jgi:hypothetical protein
MLLKTQARVVSCKSNSYSTKTKADLESTKWVREKIDLILLKLRMNLEKKESIFSKFKSSKTGSEFFSKLKKKK